MGSHSSHTPTDHAPKLTVKISDSLVGQAVCTHHHLEGGGREGSEGGREGVRGGEREGGTSFSWCSKLVVDTIGITNVHLLHFARYISWLRKTTNDKFSHLQ